jgi:hypothetical protein
MEDLRCFPLACALSSDTTGSGSLALHEQPKLADINAAVHSQHRHTSIDIGCTTSEGPGGVVLYLRVPVLGRIEQVRR